jgi:cysteine-rich repeat protein
VIRNRNWRAEAVRLRIVLGLLSVAWLGVPAVSRATSVALPQNIAGPIGSTWFLNNNGGTSSGAPFTGSCTGAGFTIQDASAVGGVDAFDNAYEVFVNGAVFIAPALVDVTGTTMTAGPVSMSGLNVTYSFRASTTQYAARILVDFANPSGSPITVPVAVPVNFGSDGGTIVRATSSGDLAVTLADRWVVTSDSGPSDPVNTTVLWGQNAPVTPTSITQVVFDCAATNGIGATFSLTVPAGATRSLMFFAGLGNITANANTIAGAIAAAPQFNSLTTVPPDMLTGLSATQLSRIVNWVPCGNGITDAGEQCDDGNIANGDCCSSICQYEANGSPCTSDGIGCTTDVCNGSGVCQHPTSVIGTTCRADAGACDIAETCDGVSTACPADAFELAGTSCDSDAQACTTDECDGGGTCLHPAVLAGTECRASAGVCDLAEACDGSPSDCPADTKSTALCRGAAGFCDVVESCDGVNDDCPADLVEPDTVVCRADAGDCDLGESCDGIGTDCPADAKEADGTPCDDADTCTQTDQCGAGTCLGSDPLDCDDGNACTQDSCLPVGGCVNDDAPRSSCLTAQKSMLLLKQKDAGVKDKLVWKWLKGQAFGQPDLGAPNAATDYALCIYSGTTETLIADAALDAGSKWSSVGTKGYKYFDAAGSPDGVSKALAKGGAAGKTKALAKGKGSNLPDPVLADITTPVKTQLVNLDSGFCLESVFQTGDVLKSTATQFKAKAQ